MDVEELDGLDAVEDGIEYRGADFHWLMLCKLARRIEAEMWEEAYDTH